MATARAAFRCSRLAAPYVGAATLLSMDDQPVAELTITPKLADILKIFLKEPQRPRYGLQLMKLTGQASGTLYPNMAKLEKAGYLTGGKEDIDPRVAGRPARRFYRITGAGAQAARIQLAAISDRYRPPVPIAPRLAPGGAS
jgi:PadR family transcriptional regulator PadR